MSNQVFVTLPPNFLTINGYESYYFNDNDKLVYSLKSGILKPLKSYISNRFNKTLEVGTHYYQFSVNGKPKYVPYHTIYRNVNRNNIQIRILIK